MRTHIRPLTENCRTFLLSLAALLTFLLSAGSAAGQVDVWIDPGHCCAGAGAAGYNGQAPHEKELNLAVANYLQGDLLSLFYFAYKTVNLPTSFLTPYNRAEVANGLRGNEYGEQGVPYLFVSIHMNSVPNASAKGTITFYSERKSRHIDTKGYRADSTAAEYVHPDLMSHAVIAFAGCSEDDGIKVKEYDVCRFSYPPSLLIEVCFISNGCQWGHIKTAASQAEVADGIAAGVSGYLGALFASETTRLPTEAPPFQEQDRSITTRAIRAVRVLTSLEEGFEVGGFPPTGWTTQTAGLGLPHAWHRTGDPLDVGSGARSAIVGSGSAGTIDEWLISPVVAITAPEDAIKFSWSGSKLWSGAVNATLNIRESGTMTWTQLWSLGATSPILMRSSIANGSLTPPVGAA